MTASQRAVSGVVRAQESDRMSREGQQLLTIRQWAIQESLARAERIEARGGAAIPMSQVLADAQLIEAYLRGGSTS